MRIPVTVATLLAITAGTPAAAQSAADSAAIVETALNYIEGYYEGNAERMTQALHPDLAKRIVRQTDSGSVLGHMTATQLIEVTRRGGGRMIPAERRQADVTILDIYQNAASVKIVASDWIDYLHLAKWDGRWVIVNVLWELKPQG